MNTYNINDENFIKTSMYQEYMRQNPSRGNLRIRASAANGAVPVNGVKAVVTNEIEGNTVIFFEGYTNESGIIERITLPAPKLNPDDLNVPDKTTYKLEISYPRDNINQIFDVNMYENICVVQNINISPKNNIEGDN